MFSAYLKGLTLQFFREEFTEENALKEEAKVFQKFKEKIMQKFCG